MHAQLPPGKRKRASKKVARAASQEREQAGAVAAVAARQQAEAKAKGAKRAILLPVSAPFHCALMAPAAEIMAQALADVTILSPAVPVIANVSAKPVSDPNEIRQLLVAQVTGAVRWRETVYWLGAHGVTDVWEIGAGKALSGMVRRIERSITCRAVSTPEDVISAVQNLEES